MSGKYEVLMQQIPVIFRLQSCFSHYKNTADMLPLKVAYSNGVEICAAADTQQKSGRL